MLEQRPPIGAAPNGKEPMAQDKAAPETKVVTMNNQSGSDGQFKEGRGTAITSLPVMAAVAADAAYTTPPGVPSTPAPVAATPSVPASSSGK